MLKSTQLQYELEQTIAQKQAEIAAAVAAERKDILEDIRAKCKYFKVSYRELKSHLVRTPDAKGKPKKVRAKKQKFDVYGKQPSVTNQTA
jgi:DNA-binding protein H-NS